MQFWKPGLTARQPMQLGEHGQHLCLFMPKRDDRPGQVTFLHIGLSYPNTQRNRQPKTNEIYPIWAKSSTTVKE